MTELTKAHSRFDFAVGEDTGVITLADTAHQKTIRSLEDRITASRLGNAVLVPLPEDGGINGRVVLGDLIDEECDTWVAKASRFLRIGSGRLAIDAGGFPGRDAPPETTEAGDFCIVGVPPGNYKMTLYLTLASSIATDLFRRRKTSYLDWYRQSSPGTPIPRWLVDLAEERDNEFEDERLEELNGDDIEDAASDHFVEVLIQLEPATEVAEATNLLRNGGPKWERRLPKPFPCPPLSSTARRLQGCVPIARAFTMAFAKKDFRESSQWCVPELRDEVVDFLTHAHNQISDSMTLPRRVLREDIRRSLAEWKLLHSDPRTACHSMSLLRWPFRGTQAMTLVTDNSNDPDTYVRLEFAFVGTAEGLKVAGLMLTWNTPKQRRRRRRRR